MSAFYGHREIADHGVRTPARGRWPVTRGRWPVRILLALAAALVPIFVIPGVASAAPHIISSGTRTNQPSTTPTTSTCWSGYVRQGQGFIPELFSLGPRQVGKIVVTALVLLCFDRARTT